MGSNGEIGLNLYYSGVGEAECLKLRRRKEIKKKGWDFQRKPEREIQKEKESGQWPPLAANTHCKLCSAEAEAEAEAEAGLEADDLI